MCARIKTIFLLVIFLVVTSCVSHQRVEERAEELPANAWYFDSITFEVAPVTTAEKPDLDALDLFRERLHTNHLCHRNSVRFIVHKPTALFQVGPWNTPLLHHYEARHRTIQDKAPNDRHLFAFIAYIRGPWIDLGGVKLLGGIQYNTTAFAIFKGGAGNREAAVLLHEFGHLIGLVKDKDRENHDDDHQYHCANKRCVMFWSAPRNWSDFDYFCKRDIRRRVIERIVEDD